MIYQAVDRVMLPMHSILIARPFFTSAATGRALVSALRMIAARSSQSTRLHLQVSWACRGSSNSSFSTLAMPRIRLKLGGGIRYWHGGFDPRSLETLQCSHESSAGPWGYGRTLEGAFTRAGSALGLTSTQVVHLLRGSRSGDRSGPAKPGTNSRRVGNAGRIGLYWKDEVHYRRTMEPDMALSVSVQAALVLL